MKKEEQAKNKWISNMSFTFSMFMLIILLANYTFKMESNISLPIKYIFFITLLINGIVHRRLYHSRK